MARTLGLPRALAIFLFLGFGYLALGVVLAHIVFLAGAGEYLDPENGLYLIVCTAALATAWGLSPAPRPPFVYLFFLPLSLAVPIFSLGVIEAVLKGNPSPTLPVIVGVMIVAGFLFLAARRLRSRGFRPIRWVGRYPLPDEMR